MRTLKFIVNGQCIVKDPNCDFSGLVPGSEKYITADFSFSDEWKNRVKVVGFWSRLGKEYPPQLLTDGKTCKIPCEALKNKIFRMQVIGKSGDTKVKTNKIAITQLGGSL